ncbi:MAG: tetratricopeptide repeat protein [Deltaproteobacteria bacterium]|nr:tetratricopeptide repeat protein [Deltaproteobacteria bacterium]
MTILFFGALYFIYAFRPNWDIDIYWHIEVGEWIVDNLQIPHTDIFSAIASHRPWTPFQWLYEVFVYLVDDFLGFTAVRAVHAIILLAAFFLFFRFLRRSFDGISKALFIFFLFVVLFEDRIRVRPHMFNLLFEVIFLPVWFGGWEDFFRADAESGGKRSLNIRAFFPYLLIAALWANIHAGGAAIVPVSFLVILVSRFLKERLAGLYGEKTDANSIGALISFLIFTAVMAVMPGFVKGVATAFTMYKESYLLIPEWHPTLVYLDPMISGTTTPHHYICAFTPYAAAFALGFYLIAGIIRDGFEGLLKKEDAALVGLSVLFTFLSIKSARFAYLSIFPLIFLIGRFGAEAPRYVGSGAEAHRFVGSGAEAPCYGVTRKIFTLVYLAAAVLLFLASYHYSIVFQRGGIVKAASMLEYDHEPGEFPEKAVDFMREAKLEGGIFHLVRWGGFLLYNLYPDCRVFTDGRGNFTAEEREIFIESHKPMTRKETLENVFTEYRLDIAIFPAPVFPLYDWDREKWMLVYRDFDVEVFLRKGVFFKKNAENVMNYYFHGDPSVTEATMENGIMMKSSAEFLAREEVANRIELLSKKPDDFEKSKDLGLIYFASGDYATALKYFKSSLETGRQDPTALLYFVWCNYLLNNHDTAGEYLQRLKAIERGLPVKEKEIIFILEKEIEKR